MRLIPQRWRRFRPRVPVLFDAHPFEITFGFAMFISGIRALVSGESSPSVNDALPPSLLLTFQVMSFLAGLCILVGLPFRSKMSGRTVERIGCLLAAGTYAAYAIILGLTLPLSLSWSIFTTILAIAVAFWRRARVIRKTEQVIERTLRAASKASDPLDLMRRIVDSRGIDDGDAS